MGETPEGGTDSRKQSGGLKGAWVKMGWKTINGRRYYYKSRRVGSRVESTYFGPAGEFGALMAYIDGIERLEKAADRW